MRWCKYFVTVVKINPLFNSKCYVRALLLLVYTSGSEQNPM